MERVAPKPLVRQRNILLVVLIGLAVAGWVVVVQQARGDMEVMPRGLGLTGGMAAPLFLGMWIAMMVAMMFPASAPMILMFTTLQSRKREAGRPYVPASIFVAAYLLVWTAFGVLAFLLASAVDGLADRSGWLTTQWPRIAGGLVIAAGVYQVSPLKDVCLGKCRTPFGFLMQHWRDGRAGAFTMGVRHGTYCLGCCWLLFVILVPLGVMNLAAMAAITVLVFAEKTMPRGHGLARVAAGALVVFGALVIVRPETLPGMM